MKTNLIFTAYFGLLISLTFYFGIQSQDQKQGDCSEYLYSIAQNIIDSEDFYALDQNFQERIVEYAIFGFENDPFRDRPSMCWEEQTPQSVIDAYWVANPDVQHSLKAPSFNFQIGDRWINTATGSAGTQGDQTILTWSYVPDGTQINSNCQGGPAAPSDLYSWLNGVYGDFNSWHQLFVDMFAVWESKSGLTFIYEPFDDGGALPNSTGVLGTRGDIRISSRFVDGDGPGILACNFFPDLGDMILDSGHTSFYQPSNNQGVSNVLAHEVGHGLGFSHVESSDRGFLMEPFISTAFDGPQEDDILAVNRNYGDGFEPNDDSGSSTAIGTISVPDLTNINCGSIDDDSDLDYYSFTANSNFDLRASVIPIGTTYNEGPQGGSQSPFNALALGNLRLDIIDQNGITVIGSAFGEPSGTAEIVNLTSLISGTYYARVSNEGDNQVQMYQLELDLSEIACAPDAGLQTSNLGAFCSDIQTGLVFGGSAQRVNVVFQDLPNQPAIGLYSYAWILTNESTQIVNVIGSNSYDINNPGTFGDDIPLQDISGNMLPVGQYCIHGISYLDSDIPANLDGINLTFLQSSVGEFASTVAGNLTENDGIETLMGSLCADLNVSTCTAVTIYPSPEIIANPELVMSCVTGNAEFCATARVAPTGNGSVPLLFELQVRNGNNWESIDSDDTDLGGSQGLDIEACFTIENLTSDMQCDHYRVLVSAIHSPEFTCSTASESAPLIVHTPKSTACNNKVNVSLDGSCAGNFNAISFLEGEQNQFCGIDGTDYYDMFYDVYYVLPNGTRLDEEDDITSLAGSCVTFEVVDNCFPENMCWGEVCIEDKLLPSFTECLCPPVGSSDRNDYLEACRLKCYQKDLIQDGIEAIVNSSACNYLPFPFVEDNCLYQTPNNTPVNSWNLPEVSFSDLWLSGECGQEWLQRTYVLHVQKRNENTGALEIIGADTCVYEFIVDSFGAGPTDTVGINTVDELLNIIPDVDKLYLPVSYIELGCDSNIDPFFLAGSTGAVPPGGVPTGFDQSSSPQPSGDFSGTVGIEESNQGIPYAYPFYYGRGQGCRLYPQRIDDNTCNLSVIYVDTPLESCGTNCYGNKKTIRDWTILDWCGAQVVEWSQLFKAIDNTPPTLAVQDITVSVDPWNCTADVVLPDPDFVHDDCDDLLVSYNVVSLNGIVVTGDTNSGFVAQELSRTMPGQTHELIYEAFDCCGNQGTTTMNVTVVDLTAPVAVALENIALSITTLNPDTSGIGKIFAKDIDNGSHDECGPVQLEIRRAEDICGFVGNATFNNDGHNNDDPDDSDNGEFVKFCCDDLQDDGTGVLRGSVDVILRVWDDADMDGVFGSAGDNYNESWSTIVVEDKLGINPQCPPNVILECVDDKEDIDNTGAPGPSVGTCSTFAQDSTYTDNFTRKNSTDAPELNSIVGAVVEPFDPVCRVGAIRRNWTSGCIQWIIFVDNGERFDPKSIVYPEDFTVDCEDFEAGEPTWNPVSCHLIGYSVESDTFNFEQGACLKVLNSYTVIDWCEYDPTDSDLNSVTESSDDGIVPGLWGWTQTIKLIDTDDPTVEYTGEKCFAVNVECKSNEIELIMVGDDSGDCPSPWLKWDVQVDLWGEGSVDHSYSTNLPANNPYHIPPSARGAELSVTIPAGVEVSNSDHLVYITVSDGCGNVTSLVETIEIIDKKKPTPYCLNLSTALMSNGEVEVWACDFNAGSFDNCTPENWLRYTFVNVNPDSLTFDDDKYDETLRCQGRVFTDADLANDTDGDGIIQIEMYVWDEYGNSDFCIVNLRLLNNQGRANVEGEIRTENGLNLPDVKMTIVSNVPEYPESIMTDVSGHYAFMDNPKYIDYNIDAAKDIDHLNGVSTLDLVLIQRHILGIKNLESAYKLIAADINNDENVSTIDLIELRKLILGIYQDFPQNESWRFVAERSPMDDNHPWPFAEHIHIEELSSNIVDENFVAVKVGDVNSSVELGFQGDKIINRSRNLELIILDQDYSEHEEIRVPVNSTNFSEIYGYQFTLEQEGLKLLNVEPGVLEMNMENTTQLDNDLITVSWNNEEPVSVEQKDVLFILVFEATKSGSTNTMRVSSNVTRAEAYVGSEYEEIGVILRGEVNYNNSLYQNEPNPFSSFTRIGFDLSEDGIIEFKVTDLTGKLLRRIKDSYSKGHHVIELDASELGASGILYYSIESGSFASTKKMVVIR